jgi:flavin-dependent thymidylate synthase
MQSQPVELVAIHGDDITPAQAAWYSTAKELSTDKLSRVPPMLRTLAEGDAPEHLPHSVPFEHTLISFRVTSEIATHIHFLKHRIGVSISSQSARWMEFKQDTYYVPDDWPEEVKENYRQGMEGIFQMYHATIQGLIAYGVDRKRAKESARLVLPYATQIRYLVTFNFLSFIHFQNLRNTDHAQREIQLIAAEMLRLVRETGRFAHSLAAWGYD